MGKSRTSFIMASVLFFVSSLPLHAQGYPVLDIANLFQAIDTLYATYDHVSQTIEMVKNTYNQLQKQIQMVKNMNWNDVAETFRNMDPTSLEGILTMRHQIDDVVYYVNRNMNLINAVEDTLTKKTINFGGKKYTFGGLFGFGQGSENTTVFDLPKNIIDYVDETAHETIKGYEGRLTYKQKEAIMRRHGLSPRNYAKIRMVEEQTNVLIKDMLTSGTNENAIALLHQAAENQKAIDAISTAAGESMVGHQQATTSALLYIATGLTRLEIGVNRLSGYMAQSHVQDQYIEELKAKQEEIQAQNIRNERIKWTEFQPWF
jgi:hypothetical protein